MWRIKTKSINTLAENMVIPWRIVYLESLQEFGGTQFSDTSSDGDTQVLREVEINHTPE